MAGIGRNRRRDPERLPLPRQRRFPFRVRLRGSISRSSISVTVRLLFDANLSPKLVNQLIDLFPGSVHLFDLSLPRDAADTSIWEYAKNNGLDIITTDGDDYPPMVS
jgi:hypothetical protein